MSRHCSTCTCRGDARTCANDRCQKSFTVGLNGRRADARYCSDACKNAQMQREHRQLARAS